MKEFDIFEKDQNSAKLKYTIGIAMLVIGAVMLYEKSYLGTIFIFIGAGLSLVTWCKGIDNKSELAKISDRAGFEREFSNGQKYIEFGLVITDNYAIVVRPALKIYRFDEMAKFEVGIAGEREKALFLTDKNGTRHPVARTFKGDGNQASFDKVYYYVSNKFIK